MDYTATSEVSENHANEKHHLTKLKKAHKVSLMENSQVPLGLKASCLALPNGRVLNFKWSEIEIRLGPDYGPNWKSPYASDHVD